MDPDRFDRLTRTLIAPSRRGALRSLAGGALGLALTRLEPAHAKGCLRDGKPCSPGAKRPCKACCSGCTKPRKGGGKRCACCGHGDACQRSGQCCKGSCRDGTCTCDRCQGDFHSCGGADADECACFPHIDGGPTCSDNLIGECDECLSDADCEAKYPAIVGELICIRYVGPICGAGSCEPHHDGRCAIRCGTEPPD
jgi:hypothetical protein